MARRGHSRALGSGLEENEQTRFLERKESYHVTQQFHSQAYTQENWEQGSRQVFLPRRSQQHGRQQPQADAAQVCPQMDRQTTRGLSHRMEYYSATERNRALITRYNVDES